MKDIRWLLNRLMSMNAPEIIWRVQQKHIQKREKSKIYALHCPITKVPLPQKLAVLNADATRIPFNAENDNSSLFESLDIFGQFEYQKYKKHWNAGFQTNNAWPENKFSPYISISQREDVGDIRTNWELNRHFQFSCLAKNYYITGQVEYLNELEDLFEDWNTHNLFLHGTEWTSAMEVGIRVNSWIYTYVFLTHSFRQYGIEKRAILDELCHGIKGMVDYIVKHRARFSSANNHLIIEMYAVGMAGFLFGYIDWIELSIKILTEELPKQNYKDGVNKEMSLHYQSFVMEAYGLLCLTMKHNECIVPQIWRQYLSNMSQYLADCCGDYGEVIVFGDNDEGKVLDLQGKIKDYYRYVLQLMGIVLENKYTDLPLIENISWITDSKQQEEYKSKELYMPGLVSHYETGGYTILRSRDRKVLLAMDHAELGFGSIAAHGHCDALSIQAFYEGKPVLIDSGTYNYHVPKHARNEMRSTKAHNTVYVEGIEQAEMLGPFLWGKRYTIGTDKYNQTENDVKIKCFVKYENIVHIREIEFDFYRNIAVTDWLQTPKDGNQIWIFNKEFFDDEKLYSLEISEQTMKKNMQYSCYYGQLEDAIELEVPVKDKTVMKISLR